MNVAVEVMVVVVEVKLWSVMNVRVVALEDIVEYSISVDRLNGPALAITLCVGPRSRITGYESNQC